MISKQTIDYILDRCNIVDVARDCVTNLKQCGTTYKACCPFHTERTPSFTVFPNTNTFKCFGCGEHGDAIKLVMRQRNMSFTEAVKELASRYNIEVEESHLTEKEEQDFRTKQAMWTANERLMTVYAEELQKNKAAREYAYRRWGEDFCKLIGVGFCPKGAKLVDKAKISDELCGQMGLKNKGGYDLMNGRITIPIRDRQQHVIGFTARVTDDSEPKYMNSKASLVYDKSKSVFGIDMAYKEATKTEKFYMVEGAPDCMRMHIIGILNTVAPLGTAWSGNHFDMLKRTASQLCFMPDADPPKDGKRFGIGIEKVMKSGEDAIRKGFSVSVRQIPVIKDKQDPDSFCTSKAKFNELNEVSYIEWLAELLFIEGMTTDEEVKIIERIALILSYIKDDTVIDRYASKLTRFAKDKRMWKKQVERQRILREQEEQKTKEQEESLLFRKFGFNISKENYYYSYSDDGRMSVWSNFILVPLFHIKDNVSPKRLYIIRNMLNDVELVELRQEELVGITKFKIKVEGMGNFLWKTGNMELEKLKAYLYSNTKSALEVKKMGWQPKQRVYAFGNGIFDGKEFKKVDEYGIVQTDKGYLYLPAHSMLYIDDNKFFQFEKKFVHLGLSAISMRELTERMFTVFGNNGRVGFLYVLASIFRDIATRETNDFPILDLFGPKGSGKSKLGDILTSFFIMGNKAPNFKNTTRPAMSEMMAASSNALVHFDEYKNDLDVKIIEFLKALWDGTGRTRMNMDIDKKKETTSVENGVIISGQEMPTVDNALFSRLIFLTFPKSVFTEEEGKRFNELYEIRLMGFSHLTLQILSKRERVESQYRMMFYETLKDVTERTRTAKIEDRIKRNWVKILAVFRCLEAHIDTSLTYKQMLELCVEGIFLQNSLCKQNNELARFWETFNFLKTEGELLEGGDYKIRYLDRLRTNKVDARWDQPHAVIFFHKTRVFDMYRLQGKKQGDSVLPDGSLKYYLETSAEFLGYKGAYRFNTIIRGIQKIGEGGRAMSSTYSAYCFDYEALRRNYGINLENDTFTKEEEDEDNKEEKESEEDTQTEIPF